MSVTSEINGFKGQLETAMGEIRRVELLLQNSDIEKILGENYDVVMESLNTVGFKVKKVRASL